MARGEGERGGGRGDATLQEAFQRYREVIPDWERFLEAVATPEPTALRARTLRMEPEVLRHRLDDQGFAPEPVPGLPGYLTLRARPRSVARTLEHWLGFLNVQQSVMGLPPRALEPRPGERVLDLCAAPGGKASHMAELMEDRGTLVAVDPAEKRLRGFLGNLYRLLHPNVLVVAADGRELPDGVGFDRVLADVPCSAEGNARRKGRPPRRTVKFERYVTQLQERLLTRAVDLVRPGGVVVYSTCTFAPEENEAVVSRVLANRPVDVEPIPLDQPHAPGLTAFQGEEFDPRLADAWRVYPHHLDSGGLFMVRLRRREEGMEGSWGEGAGGDGAWGDGSGGDRSGWVPVPRAFPGEEPEASRVEATERLLQDTFGVEPVDVTPLQWLERGKSGWLHRCAEWPLGGWRPSGAWRVISAGVRAFNEGGPDGVRPTNDVLRLLSDGIRRRRVDLEREELLELLRGEALPVEPHLGEEAGGGPVALCLDGQVMGRGVVTRQGLISNIPKRDAGPLREILE